MLPASRPHEWSPPPPPVWPPPRLGSGAPAAYDQSVAMTSGRAGKGRVTAALEAVIFDVDGTLVDSEQSGHRVAFNEAFAAFDLPDRWDPATYRDLLAVTGGERRLLHWLSCPESSCPDVSEERRRDLARALHRWKTERFVELAASGAIPVRPGAVRLLDELERDSITVAVATTGSKTWVEPLLDSHFGAGRFGVVVAGEDVQHRKPDPEVYLIALGRLDVVADAALAVEDSGPGWAAARGAGLGGVIVANDETSLAEVADADVVVDGFGEIDDAVGVIADRFGVISGCVTSATLASLAAARATAYRGAD